MRTPLADRLTKYQPSPNVPISELRLELDSISETRGALFQAMVEGYEPPEGAFEDLNVREDAVVAAMNLRRGGSDWARLEDRDGGR